MVVLSLLRPTARSVRSLPRFASPCASCRHRWTTIVWTDGSVKLNERFIPLPNQSLSRFGLDPRESPPRGWPAAPSGPAGPERRRGAESLWLLKWSPGQRESPFGIVDSDSRLHRRLPQKAVVEGGTETSILRLRRRIRRGEKTPAPLPSVSLRRYPRGDHSTPGGESPAGPPRETVSDPLCVEPNAGRHVDGYVYGHIDGRPV